MAILPSINTISGFLINILYNSWNYLIPCKVCNEGEALIKKQLGKPIYVYKNAGLYWKIPFIEEFDVINTKTQTSFLNAHSMLMVNRKDAMIPTNIVIDAQLEYKITDPLCIYTLTEAQIVVCIDNKVHEIISKVIDNCENIDKIEPDKFYKAIETVLGQNNSLVAKVISLKKESDKLKWFKKILVFGFTNSFLLYPLCYFYFNEYLPLFNNLYHCYVNVFYIFLVILINILIFKRVKTRDDNELEEKNVIELEKIIITSFDYNISLRTTQ